MGDPWVLALGTGFISYTHLIDLVFKQSNGFHASFRERILHLQPVNPIIFETSIRADFYDREQNFNGEQLFLDCSSPASLFQSLYVAFGTTTTRVDENKNTFDLNAFSRQCLKDFEAESIQSKLKVVFLNNCFHIETVLNMLYFTAESLSQFRFLLLLTELPTPCVGPIQFKSSAKRPHIPSMLPIRVVHEHDTFSVTSGISIFTQAMVDDNCLSMLFGWMFDSKIQGFEFLVPTETTEKVIQSYRNFVNPFETRFNHCCPTVMHQIGLHLLYTLEDTSCDIVSIGTRFLETCKFVKAEETLQSLEFLCNFEQFVRTAIQTGKMSVNAKMFYAMAIFPLVVRSLVHLRLSSLLSHLVQTVQNNFRHLFQEKSLFTEYMTCFIAFSQLQSVGIEYVRLTLNQGVVKNKKSTVQQLNSLATIVTQHFRALLTQLPPITPTDTSISFTMTVSFYFWIIFSYEHHFLCNQLKLADSTLKLETLTQEELAPIPFFIKRFPLELEQHQFRWIYMELEVERMSQLSAVEDYMKLHEIHHAKLLEIFDPQHKSVSFLDIPLLVYLKKRGRFSLGYAKATELITVRQAQMRYDSPHLLRLHMVKAHMLLELKHVDAAVDTLDVIDSQVEHLCCSEQCDYSALKIIALLASSKFDGIPTLIVKYRKLIDLFCTQPSIQWSLSWCFQVEHLMRTGHCEHGMVLWEKHLSLLVQTLPSTSIHLLHVLYLLALDYSNQTKWREAISVFHLRIWPIILVNYGDNSDTAFLFHQKLFELCLLDQQHDTAKYHAAMIIQILRNQKHSNVELCHWYFTLAEKSYKHHNSTLQIFYLKEAFTLATSNAMTMPLNYVRQINFLFVSFVAQKRFHSALSVSKLQLKHLKEADPSHHSLIPSIWYNNSFAQFSLQSYDGAYGSIVACISFIEKHYSVTNKCDSRASLPFIISQSYSLAVQIAVQLARERFNQHTRKKPPSAYLVQRSLQLLQVARERVQTGMKWANLLSDSQRTQQLNILKENDETLQILITEFTGLSPR